MAKSPFIPPYLREYKEKETDRPFYRDLVMCEWCGAETRLTWHGTLGYCRACHRELSRKEKE